VFRDPETPQPDDRSGLSVDRELEDLAATFLDNHVKTLVSVDFFTVPTIRFQIRYVFLVLAHERRRVLHFNITAHPTAEGTGQQLREAFPFETGCQLLVA
jgi:putative transposase